MSTELDPRFRAPPATGPTRPTPRSRIRLAQHVHRTRPKIPRPTRHRPHPSHPTISDSSCAACPQNSTQDSAPHPPPAPPVPPHDLGFVLRSMSTELDPRFRAPPVPGISGSSCAACPQNSTQDSAPHPSPESRVRLAQHVHRTRPKIPRPTRPRPNPSHPTISDSSCAACPQNSTQDSAPHPSPESRVRLAQHVHRTRTEIPRPTRPRNLGFVLRSMSTELAPRFICCSMICYASVRV